MGTMEVLGADPPADFEALGLWAAALVNELPPLQAVRDIRLHVLRETDSLRRMHLVRLGVLFDTARRWRCVL